MPRNNSLDFPHTCPKIDKAIGECKDILESHLYDYIIALSPYIPESTASKLSKEWSKDVYDSISHCFESVRETNEELRDAANQQISNLEDDIYNLKEEINHLERQVNS